MSPPGADLRPAPVLVTGASGFLGAHLCRTLREAGWPVRALVRRGGGRAPEGVEAVEGDGLFDDAALRRAADGVAAVVHAAGRAHVLREHAADPGAEFRRVNVEGTVRVLDAAAAAGARDFVFVSSVAAVASRGTGEVLDESTPPAPDTPYGRSKLEAEGALFRRAAETGVRAAALRPPMIYGAGMKGNPLRLLRLVDGGIPVPVPARAGARSLAYAGNVAAAAAALLDAPAAAGAFFVRDAADVTTPELVRAMGAALGRPPRLLPVPLPLMRAAGRAGDLLSRAVPFPLDSDAVDRLFGALRVDASRLERETGFRPPFTLAEGMAATAAWFRAARGAR